MVTNERLLQKRIEYEGDPDPLFSRICADFNVGSYLSYREIPVGYEDYNVVLTTNRGNYFAKLFAKTRSEQECKQIVTTFEHVLAAGVNHPQLYTSPQGHMDTISLANTTNRVCLMEYINGKNFYEAKHRLSRLEQQVLIEQTAMINKIDYHPPAIYDSWSITNMAREYTTHKGDLEEADRTMVAPVVAKFAKVSLDTLPHAFVHGDIISTNVMKNRQGKFYILDFAVANWYPRIQELAMLLCDLLFDPDSPADFLNNYKWAVEEYQKHINLTPEELRVLPTFAKATHAMHIIGASRERAKGNIFGENIEWLILGRKGLKMGQQL